MPNQRYQRMLDTIDAQLTSKDNKIIRWAKIKQAEKLIKERMSELRAQLIEEYESGKGDPAFDIKYFEESSTMPTATVLFEALKEAIGEDKAEVFYEENKGTKSAHYRVTTV